jgi:hypothetical protein
MPDQHRTRKESGRQNGLTPIPPSIHCPATTERVCGNDELDEITVEHFLDTLAEVALAIAYRKLRPELAGGLAKAQPGGEVDP